MRKFLSAFLFGSMLIGSANANVLEFDSSDPLYMLKTEEILSETSASFGRDILRFGDCIFSNEKFIHAITKMCKVS